MKAAAFLLACTLAGLLAGAGGWYLVDARDRDAAGAGAATDTRVVTTSGPSAPAAADPAAGSAPASSGVAATGLAGAAPPPGTPTLSYHDGIMRAAPSVVSVYTRRTDTRQGSGVVVGADGIVLTNLHLVDGAERIGVQLSDGSLHAGTLVGSDAETDVAVLRIGAGPLPAMSLDEAPPLHVGDVVLAIGNPFGVGQTVTQGIVSATRRRVEGGSAWQNFVQIDAAINPGSSGGALIDPLGRLVGITTAVLQREGGAQGIGFAIPAELLAQVVPQIVAEGRVVRGWLGIGADDIAMFPDLVRAGLSGAVITDVLPGSPAALGGLARRDVVSAVDGRPVVDATALLLTVSALAPGREVVLEVSRAGATPDEDAASRRVTVTLGERPGDAGVPPTE